MLGPDDLVLCAATLAQVPFVERIEAAAAAGFKGISMWSTDYAQARAAGVSDAELRSRLTDHGLEVAELDPLLNWLPGAGLGADANQEGMAFFRANESDFYRMSEAVGARSINVALFTDAPIERAALVEPFAALCDRAKDHGLLVHLEFMPFTQVPDLAAALEVVSAADRANGGVTLDTWHHFRSGATAETLLDAPGARVLAVQISDAPREPHPDVIEETMRLRRVPGEGDIDLAELLAALRAIGSPAPLGVEIFSDELAALPAKEAAQRAADSVRDVLERARSL